MRLSLLCTHRFELVQLFSCEFSEQICLFGLVLEFDYSFGCGECVTDVRSTYHPLVEHLSENGSCLVKYKLVLLHTYYMLCTAFQEDFAHEF